MSLSGEGHVQDPQGTVGGAPARRPSFRAACRMPEEHRARKRAAWLFLDTLHSVQAGADRRHSVPVRKFLIDDDRELAKRY